MMNICKKIALALSLSFSTCVHAEFSVSPMLAYEYFDSNKLGNRNLSDAPEIKAKLGASVIFDYRYKGHWSLGSTLIYVPSTVKNYEPVAKVNDLHLSANAFYWFNEDGRFAPYVLGGLGFERFKTDYQNANHTSPTAEVGFGARFRVLPNLTLRGDARNIFNINKEKSAQFIMLGLMFEFGKVARNVYVPTTELVEVVEAPVDVVDTPKDTDKDGVFDVLDKCPDTPEGVVVDQAGCPLDQDQDGVPDYLDQCPNTPEDVEVDERGCEKQLTAPIQKDILINFDTNKSIVKDQYMPEVEAVAELAKKYPSAFIEIQGHTDSSGQAGKNQVLSQERAGAVRSVLITRFGVDPARVTANGYGATQPIADNSTAEGKAKNRRVIAVLSAKATTSVKKKRK